MRWIRKTTRLAIYLRDEFTCLYCGKNLHHEDPFNVTLDHLDPRSNGGNNHPDNLVTACRSCNSARQDKPWREYATGGAIERIEIQRHQKLNRALARKLVNGNPENRVTDLGKR